MYRLVVRNEMLRTAHYIGAPMSLEAATTRAELETRNARRFLVAEVRDARDVVVSTFRGAF